MSPSLSITTTYLIFYFQIEAYGNESLQKIKPNFLDKVKLLIEVPYSYDLYLKSLAQTAVTVEKLECNDIEIHAETDCHLSQLKCRSITVNSNSGKYGQLARSVTHDTFRKPVFYWANLFARIEKEAT